MDEGIVKLDAIRQGEDANGTRQARGLAATLIYLSLDRWDVQ